MEEEDSYYYHHPVSLVLRFLETNAAISQSSCLQKRLFQEFCGQTSIIQQLNSLANYQNYQHIERVKPLVPGFEDPYKKVKSEYKDDSTNSELKTEESISTSSDSITLKTESLTFQDHVHPQEIVTQNDFFRATIKQEDVKIEETHVETPLEVDDFPECSTAPTYKDWNKKDLKKLNKFLSLCKTYQEKLAMDNPLVFEKFQQIATLVIPQLLTHFKSKPFEAVSAAILLYACREVKYPVTLKQIVSISDSKEKLINKCVFSIKEIFPLNAEVKHFKAGEFIHVLAEKLKLGDSVRAAAVKMFENIEKLGLMKSIHAMTLAACCVKIACSLSNSEQDLDSLAVAAGTTKTTLRNMYRKLFPHRFCFITKDCKLSDPKDLKDL